MKPVLTVEGMRAVDEKAQYVVGLDVLIERAGYAVAISAARLLQGCYGKHIIVIAGKGHNGDDGRVAAAVLSRRGAHVRVIDASSAPKELPAAELIIDAAFGLGFRGTYVAPRPTADALVLSVDIPSGVDADTGVAEPGAVRADVTVTFGALKPGLLFGEGAERCGRIEIADIGLPIESTAISVCDDEDLRRFLVGRCRESHKWMSATYVVAGSPGMTGAPVLVAEGALRAGAGMVRLGSPGILLGEKGEMSVTEVVGRPLPAADFADEVLAELDRCHSLVVGPGLGTKKKTVSAVTDLVGRAELPVVIDADGLNALATLPDWHELIGYRQHSTVLTPHDGEFARLHGKPVGQDRIHAARELVASCNATVLLKGPTTVVASPAETICVTSGSPRLATAGTGDVLSGVIGAFLARGVETAWAAALGAYVHGRAAARGHSTGLVASDLPALIADAERRRNGASIVTSYRPSWVEIDVGAIEHNANELARLVAPSGLCAVVKADGYGHGAVPVARAALKGGAVSLAVALVEEGVVLRDAGIAAPILLLSEPEPDAIRAAIDNALTLTLYTAEGIAHAREVAGSNRIPVHLKLDTGMHRVGCDEESLLTLATAIDESDELELQGLWTHLAVADELSDRFTDTQLDRFQAALEMLRSRGIAPTISHVANSAAALHHPNARFDLVRCGIALYGYSPIADESFGDDLSLRPALSLKSRVHMLRDIEAGERPSYGRRRALAKASRVAAVPLGYADGVPRALAERGAEVLIGGIRRPFAGTITMDQVLIDCGDDETVAAGDEVVFLGRQGDSSVTADEWARILGTISYEVLCGIGPRVPRTVTRTTAMGGRELRR